VQGRGRRRSREAGPAGGGQRGTNRGAREYGISGKLLGQARGGEHPSNLPMGKKQGGARVGKDRRTVVEKTPQDGFQKFIFGSEGRDPNK